MKISDIVIFPSEFLNWDIKHLMRYFVGLLLKKKNSLGFFLHLVLFALKIHFEVRVLHLFS